LCNSSSGSITVNLPASSGNSGRILYIKNTGGSGNSVTVTANGTETIDGSNSQTVSDYDTLKIVCDGNNWWVI